jgi:hypothetical protein
MEEFHASHFYKQADILQGPNRYNSVYLHNSMMLEIPPIKTITRAESGVITDEAKRAYHERFIDLNY